MTVESGQPVQAQPKKKRGCFRWILYGILGFVVLAVLASLLGSPEEDSNPIASPNADTTSRSNISSTEERSTASTTVEEAEDAEPLLFTRENWNELATEPGKFKGAQVDIVGRVFAGVEKTSDGTAWQMFADPKNSEWNTIVMLEDSDFDIENGDYVSVIGVVQKEQRGKNAFGGTISAPLVVATDAQVVDALAAATTPIKTIDEAATINQHELQVTLNKVEFAPDETRLFVTVRNGTENEANFYTFNARAVQGSTQYEAKTLHDYPDIQSSLLPGVESSGVIVFPTMDVESSANFYLESRTDDFSTSFDQYIFTVGDQTQSNTEDAANEGEAATETELVDAQSATVEQWIVESQRPTIAEYWATFWAEQGANELTTEEMQICIDTKILEGCCGYEGQIPSTMLIMSVASECVE